MTATATKRFSKQTMIEDLQTKAAKLEADYGFESWHGNYSARKYDTDATIAFGQYRAYLDLLDQIKDNDF